MNTEYLTRIVKTNASNIFACPEEEIENVSAITHAHRISKTACVLYVHIVQELLKGAGIMEAVHA